MARPKSVVIIEAHGEIFAICGTDAGVEIAKEYGAPLTAREIQLLTLSRKGKPIHPEMVKALARLKRVFPSSKIEHCFNRTLSWSYKG